MSRFFMDDWAEGGSKHFAAVKNPEAPVVHSVDQISHIGIIACRQYRKGHLKIKVQHEDLQLCVPGTGLHQGKSVATIVQIARGHVFAMVDRGLFKTGPAHLAKPTSDATAVQKEAERFWRSFWQSCQSREDEENCRQHVNLLPQLPDIDATFNMHDLRSALQSLQIKKARGPDAWGNFDLKYLPDCLLPRLLKLLNLFTRTGTWPQAMMHAKVHLLAKTMEVRDISSTRPITILSNVYRVWARMVTSRVFKHIKGHYLERFLVRSPENVLMTSYFPCSYSLRPISVQHRLGRSHDGPLQSIQHSAQGRA